MIFENELKNFVSANFNIWSTLFWWHQKRELKRHKAFFDSVEKQPLTDLQRRSIILDERRNLVVAGAGTGKTSVIVAKAGYLLKSGKCRPEEILLLAFNSPAAAELRERCEKRLGTIIEALTFHKLGKTIIEAAAGHSQTVSKLATDPAKFQNLIDDYIQEIQRNPEKWKKFRAFVLGHLKPYRSEIEFDTLDKYIAYIRSVDLRSLSGDLVKSFAELDIANFLFLMGVPFECERRYPHVKKSYQPDFYLPDQDLYIEHFGIDRDGGTAPFIDSDIYRRDMDWKRDLHQKNETKLRETYSWQRSEGVLLEAVIEIMKEHSVEYAPRSDEEVLEAIKTCGYVTQLSRLLSTFLNHFKSNQLHFSELCKRAQNSDAPKRSGLFVDLFIEICERYEDALHQNEDEIDFNDMISQATSLIQDGRYRVPWKYLIVDEFQDISVGRYKLLDAMLKTREDFRFFAVGDDWQSIYRFGGSGISIMSQFRNFFGRATVVKLEKTFRFNDRIAEVSGKFIQRNPKQISKTLSTVIHKPKPQVFLHVKTRKWGDDLIEAGAVFDIIELVNAQEETKSKSLMILARYNHAFRNRQFVNDLKKLWPGSLLEPRTVHSAKGLEADFVIVMGMSSDRFGFPSEIEDDPLLSLVLAEPDDYPNAEERRLFYVALTRAREQVHLVVDAKTPSIFANEMIDEEYNVQVLGRDPNSDERCPECRTGIVEEKKKRFFSCSNFPFCEYVAPTCSTCESSHMAAPMEEEAEGYICSDEDCLGTANVCPECEIGALVPKSGRFGDFLGCHIWPRCDFTRKLQPCPH